MYVYVFTYMAIGLLTISPEVVKVLSPKTYWTGIGYVNLIVIASFLIYLLCFFYNISYVFEKNRDNSS